MIEILKIKSNSKFERRETHWLESYFKTTLFAELQNTLSFFAEFIEALASSTL